MENKYCVIANDDWAESFVLRVDGTKEQLYQGHSERDAYVSILQDLQPDIIERLWENDNGWAYERGCWGLEYFDKILENQ